jgi:hypothetical protein
MTSIPRGALCAAVLCLILALFAPPAWPSVPAASVHPLLSSRAYDQLLDILFSHQTPGADKIRYEMALRFMTSSHPESAIVIDVFQTGEVQAWLFRVSGPSAWGIANQYVQDSGREEIGEISKLVQVSKQRLAVSLQQADTWHAACMKSLAQAGAQLEKDSQATKSTGDVRIFLDGTIYGLSVAQDGTDIQWRLVDEEVNDSSPAGVSPLARWMNDVRRYALASALGRRE